MKIKKEDIAQMVIEASDRVKYSNYSSMLIAGIDDLYAKCRFDIEKIFIEVIYELLNDDEQNAASQKAAE